MRERTIAVRVRDDAHARVAWAVASHPSVTRVVMVGRRPPSSWHPLVVAGSIGDPHDLTVDPDPEDEGIVATAGTDRRPGIIHGSPEGLARALVATSGDPTASPGWTVVGKPRREGTTLAFPQPLGVLRARSGEAPTESLLGAAGAFGAKITVALDQRKFLAAVCIAAAAVIADPELERPTPVWERADAYVKACEDLGLVVAEALSA